MSIPHPRSEGPQDDRRQIDNGDPAQLRPVPPSGIQDSSRLPARQRNANQAQPAGKQKAQHGRMVRMYLLYFHALLRFVQDATAGRLMCEQHFNDSFGAYERSLLGLLWHSNAPRLSYEQAIASIQESLVALPVSTPGRRYTYDEIIGAYQHIQRLYDLSKLLPGQPSVGPWWMRAFSPLLRGAAFSWLDRCYREDYLNRTN
jgi:hypothetical protein